MATRINPEKFVSASVEFSCSDQTVYSKYNIGLEDLKEISRCCESSPEPSAIFAGLIYPIRTNRSFFRDFFLPTYMNHTCTIENVALRALAIFAAILLDVISFPVRFAFTPIRALWNAYRSEYPVHKFLREKNWFEGLWNAEKLCVKVKWIEKGDKNSLWTLEKDPSGKQSFKYNNKRFTEVRQVNLIDVPYFEKNPVNEYEM